MVTSGYMGGYGVDTGGFGWLLVIVNNPKIIGPKMSKIIVPDGQGK